MINTIFLNAIGTVIQLDLGSDVSTATVARIKYVKPNGDSGYWAASISTQYLSYTTVDRDLDRIGTWELQAYVETPSGKWHGEKTRFEVCKPI